MLRTTRRSRVRDTPRLAAVCRPFLHEHSPPDASPSATHTLPAGCTLRPPHPLPCLALTARHPTISQLRVKFP
jgi:hypothetical protein